MENEVNMSNIGRLVVSQDFFDSKDLTMDEKLDIFSKILIVDCTSSFINKTIDYFGISPLFRKVAPGEIIPTYICTLTKKDENSPVEYVWSEVTQG